MTQITKCVLLLVAMNSSLYAIEKAKIFVYSNNKGINQKTHRLVMNTLSGNISKEKIRVLRDVDLGLISKSKIQTELNKIEEQLQEILPYIVFLNTPHFSSCYSLSRRTDTEYKFDYFYELDGRKQQIEYPSQIIEKLKLELYVANYFIQNSSTEKPVYIRRWVISNDNDHIINMHMDYYKGFENQFKVTVDTAYLRIGFLKRMMPAYRIREKTYNIDIDNTIYKKDISTYLTKKEIFSLAVKYITYLHNNTSNDFSKEIYKYTELSLKDE